MRGSKSVVAALAITRADDSDQAAKARGNYSSDIGVDVPLKQPVTGKMNETCSFLVLHGLFCVNRCEMRDRGVFVVNKGHPDNRFEEQI